MSPKRVTVVASEVLGMPGTGGAATADSLLAIALGRHGHDVELLVAPGREPEELSSDWRQRYTDASVRVRLLQETGRITPPFLEPTMEVFEALRAEPPDVVIGDDWRGVSYGALQARRVGLAFPDTAFVVHCHAPGRMLAEFSHKVPDSIVRFGYEVAERAAVARGDAIVSPSRWLLDWMRERGWRLPEPVHFIPHVWLTAALGEHPTLAPTGMPVRRLAFFGQLREGKGIRLFLAGLNALDPDLLDGIEIVFVGRETRRWSAEAIRAELQPQTLARLSPIRFETKLDPPGALAELRRPGTLTVVPSLLDNAPYTVSECIEHGIPCIAAGTGGTPELIADEDRERVLFEATTPALAAALERALSSLDGVAPARSAVDPAETVDAWLQLVGSVEPFRPGTPAPAARVDVVATGRATAEERAQHLAEQTRSVEVGVISAETRHDGLVQATADWVIFLDPDDLPTDTLIDQLVAAQAFSRADVVTCAVAPIDSPGTLHVFLGDPGSLGLVENHYGAIGLIRRELLHDLAPGGGDVDPDWPMLARLVLRGAEIVSVPDALARHSGNIGHVADVPGDGLSVLRVFEREGEGSTPDLPQLAATIAVAQTRWPAGAPVFNGGGQLLRRSLAVLRSGGVTDLVRRAGRRLPW